MKVHLLPTAVAAVLGLSAMASHADVLLLSDDFNVTASSGQPTTAQGATDAANNNLASRLSGSYAETTSYVWSGTGGYNVQTGTTSSIQPLSPSGSTTGGNYLSLSSSTSNNSSQASVQLNLPINLALAGDHAIIVSFDMYLPASGSGGISLSNSLGTSGGGTIPASTDVFGFFANRNGGGVQEFNASGANYFANSTTESKTAISTYATSTWTLVLSDVVDGAAGTGSPFGGNGTYVSLYYGDTLINGNALATEFGNQTLYLGFSAFKNNSLGFDNLNITAVPEPASLGYLVAAGMGLVVIAARRRRMVRG